MSRWPTIGKSRLAVAVLLVLCCMVLFQACSATDCFDPDITNVCLNVTPGVICDDNEFLISFHSWTGLQNQTNGFWVFFEDDVYIPPDITEECVEIRWDCCSWKHPYNVEYYNESQLPLFAPKSEGATQAVKIWLSENIPHNQDVWIKFDCLSVPCPLDCGGFKVWVNNDIQRCPQASNLFYMKVKVIASAGPDGTITQIDPPGPTAPPTFSRPFDCGDTPKYRITADYCHVIDQIVITPCDDCTGCSETITYNNGTTQAEYQFGPLNCSYEIHATFKTNKVYAFLKYQLPKSECGNITEVKIWGGDEIQPVLNFTDDLYIGGNTSSFNLTRTSSSAVYARYLPGYVNVSAQTPDTLKIVVLTKPTSGNPETFKITYANATGTHHATVTILTDGSAVWAPAVPTGVKYVSNIAASEPFAWQPVTQDYLDCYPDWEGLVGVVVKVDSGRYTETIEIDTPGVHLKNKDGASPIIDAAGKTPKGPVSGPNGSVFLSAGCTGIEGFTIKNSKSNGVLVWPSSRKCGETIILDSKSHEECVGAGCYEVKCDKFEVPCCLGRINIVSNDIFDNSQNGIYVKDAVVLILDNKIHDNIDDGIDAGCLFCGVECVDPEAITHSPACSEIIYNEIYGNGPSGKGEWEVLNTKDGKWYFTSDPKGGCEKLPGWTDAGIQIRCVGSEGCPCVSCCECEPPCETNGGEPSDGCPSCQVCAAGALVTDGDGQQCCGGCDQALYIVHNNVTENYHAGIYLMKGATQGGNITIQGNHLIGNNTQLFGLLTEADMPCRIDFKWNDIICNKYWGVKNLACCDLIAKENYWGSPGGPSKGPEPIVQCIDCRCHEENQQSDALGNGDEVSHRVHYNPWLYKSSGDVFHDLDNGPVRMYGSDTLQLQQGWNTLSVPVKLADEGDTLIDIANMGSFITPGNMRIVYKWNAVTDRWDTVTTEQLIPGRGYYVYMKAPSRFPVLYNAGPSPGLTAVPLESGWNLIGATWGIDRLKDCCSADEGRWAVASPDMPYNDAEAFKQVTEALESIKEGNGGTKGVAIIVSPSVPGQYDIWSASVTSGFWDPVKNNQEMVTGDAYWVYMVNPGTYAGFEITPFYFPAT